ncbi:MAG: glycosyltransferase family 2 protein [Deltaproteobacteria bacterium]|nr:glycosyltransferase family 2 protein [Deltaproteobacteria bacterium]
MPEMYPSPSVTVIILNWNGLQDTLECIVSLKDMDYPDLRILVVDNGSIDGSPSLILRKHPDITLLRNASNLGFTGGNNLGIAKALEMGTDYVWLLNNDTVVEKDALKELVKGISESMEIGLASPFIHFYDAPGEVQFRGSYIDWKRRRIVKLENGGTIPQGRVSVSLWGTALLIRRDVVERVGLLNDKYFAYHEDEDYSMRVARAGYRAVVVPEARVFHKNSRSTGSNDAPMQVFLRSRNLFFLWVDTLKGMKRVSHIPRYLAHIVSYGGALREKNLPDSVEACLDGVWHAFRGAGGPRNPDIKMPLPLRRTFHFLFSWHPFFWACLLRGDISGIASNIGKRTGAMKAGN